MNTILICNNNRQLPAEMKLSELTGILADEGSCRFIPHHHCGNTKPTVCLIQLHVCIFIISSPSSLYRTCFGTLTNSSNICEPHAQHSNHVQYCVIQRENRSPALGSQKTEGQIGQTALVVIRLD